MLALTVLVILATPLLSFLRTDPFSNALTLDVEEGEMQVYQQIFDDALQAQSAQDLKGGLALLLQHEYGIAEGECEILVFFATDGTLQRVSIYVTGAALTVDPIALQEDLRERLKCPVEVR